MKNMETMGDLTKVVVQARQKMDIAN